MDSVVPASTTGNTCEQWQPSVSVETLRRKATFLRSVRHFFEQRNVLEVDTPVMSYSTATDPWLDSFEVLPGKSESPRFLLPSPEYEMKRLVAAGAGPVYQISKAFRRGEMGTRHNPEFSILEWYKPHVTLEQLRWEVVELLHHLGFESVPGVLSYRQAFIKFVGLDPFLESSVPELIAAAQQLSGINKGELSKESALDIIMTHRIEPALAATDAVFVCDYPASQAALARVGKDAEGHLVAMRFELYINGVEIANAYDELNQADELRARFTADNAKRKQSGKPVVPIDDSFLAAMAHFPPCAGIALGLDRLFMVLGKYKSLSEVLAFPAAEFPGVSRGLG